MKTTNFIIELRDTGNGPPVDVRLRRSLKILLRHFGFRCVSISDVSVVAKSSETSKLISSGEGAEPFSSDCPPGQDCQSIAQSRDDVTIDPVRLRRRDAENPTPDFRREAAVIPKHKTRRICARGDSQ